MAATFTVQDARRGTSTLLMWVVAQLPHAGGGSTKVVRRSDTDIPDVNNLMIKGRITSWGRVIRALSDRFGNHEVSRFSWTEKDFDREILDLMDDANYRYMLSGLVSLYMLTDTDRRNAEVPFRLFNGILRKVGLQPRRGLVFEAQDYLSSEFSTANDQEKLPRDLITADFFTDAPTGSLGLPIPQIYGQVDEAGPEFHGLIPCIPVGTEVISSVTWNRFLVCGHAIKEFRALFSNGVLWSAGDIGVNILAPGHTGWPFGQVYRPITVGSVTRWFTLIYVKGPIADAALDGSAPLTCNVYGIDTVGNGSGTLITDICDQYLHWYTNFGIQNWTSGAWLSIPQFHPILDTTLRIDAASFASVKGTLQSRLGGGYPGAVVIGCNGDVRTKSQWLQAWDVSAGHARHGFNRLGQFKVVLPQASAASARHTQRDDIIKDTFSCTPMDEELRNVVPFSYKRRWANQAWDLQNKKVKNNDSITKYKVRREETLQEYWFLRDDAVAENNAAHYLTLLYHPPRPVSYEVKPYALAQLELGNTVEIEHGDGPGSGGWSDRNVFVERLETSPNGRRVMVGGFDLDSIGSLTYDTEPGFIGTSTPLSFQVGSAPPEVVASFALLGGKDLGGSRIAGLHVTTWTNVRDFRVVRVDWSALPTNFNLAAKVSVYSFNTGTTITPRIITTTDEGGMTPGSLKVTGTATNAGVSAPSVQTLVIPRGTGVEYLVLQQENSNGNADTFAVGIVEPVPV